MKFITLAAVLLSSPLVFAEAKTWTVDNTHASVVFKADHLGFAPVYGLIPGMEGTVVWDDAKPDASSFDLKLPLANITTGTQKRDDHLKSADFFNIKQFPDITIKSKSVKKSGKNYDVTADVTMLGVTKPVKFTFKQNRTGKDPWGNDRTGGEATIKVKRTDFGMTYMSKKGEVSDEIELLIGVEAVQAKK